MKSISQSRRVQMKIRSDTSDRQTNLRMIVAASNLGVQPRKLPSAFNERRDCFCSSKANKGGHVTGTIQSSSTPIEYMHLDHRKKDLLLEQRNIHINRSSKLEAEKAVGSVMTYRRQVRWKPGLPVIMEDDNE